MTTDTGRTMIGRRSYVELLPPYWPQAPGRITHRRRIVHDALEVLADHQELWRFCPPEAFRPLLNLCERWWILWLAHNMACEVLEPDGTALTVSAASATAA